VSPATHRARATPPIMTEPQNFSLQLLSLRGTNARSLIHWGKLVQLPAEIRIRTEELADEVAFAELKRAATGISDAYRAGRSVSLANSTQVAAYLATRMPATYAAAEAVLRETKQALGDREVTSILDVGAGTGAASIAAQSRFQPKRITMIERALGMASAARVLVPEAEVRVDDFTRPPSLPPHDLVIAAYALGESGKLEVLERLWQAAKVALVVIEPGTSAGFQLIREVRSKLLAAGGHMVAPCPAEGVCPMPEGDWCHFGARVERTGLHRRLKDAELNYEDEKFSYVVLAREPVSLLHARIVRRPVQQPGLIMLETCTRHGLRTVHARKREREIFRAGRRASWGATWEPGND